MRSLVSLRATTSVTARSVVGLGLLVAFSSGCSVDDNGLAATSTKLQRDAGGTGGSISPTGIGGDTASGGVSGAAGAIGAGGDIASGGVNGSAGAGSGGSVAAGGGTGTGGATATGGSGAGGATATGGAPGSGGATPAGGAPGSGGATAMGGAGGVPATGTGGMVATGTGGMTSTGGAIGSGGAPGTGGMLATGGTTGTGGATALGGASGTGGATATGGTTGTGGGGGTPCGPTNCMGCCASDGQCVRTVTAKQCGSKGAACVACGPCQICGASSGTSGGGAGSCIIDPTSQWTIVADTAQLSMTPPGGGTWDPAHGDEGGSAPDPFCEYENPSGDVSATTAGVTDTVTDAFNVTWDEVITPPNVTVSASALMAAKPAWRIWVGDEDCSSPKNCGTLGQIACSYQQPINADSLMSGGLTISNYQNCVSLTLSFVCQAP